MDKIILNGIICKRVLLELEKFKKSGKHTFKYYLIGSRLKKSFSYFSDLDILIVGQNLKNLNFGLDKIVNIHSFEPPKKRENLTIDYPGIIPYLDSIRSGILEDEYLSRRESYILKLATFRNLLRVLLFVEKKKLNNIKINNFRYLNFFSFYLFDYLLGDKEKGEGYRALNKVFLNSKKTTDLDLVHRFVAKSLLSIEYEKMFIDFDKSILTPANKKEIEDILKEILISFEKSNN